ncbi:hypothetical protein GCM10010359_07570 [Streptomyces morookaense]|nr:hypothetical protein GCM10010359_07570 [Streptomyces morookaense]
MSRVCRRARMSRPGTAAPDLARRALRGSDDPEHENGEDLPYVGGSVRYALDYYRNHGKHPDGREMGRPELDASDLTIMWDVAPFGPVEEACSRSPPA